MSRSAQELTDRVAIVTGGAGGLGLAIVEALLEAGARCIVADVRDDTGHEAARQLGTGAPVSFVHLDVTDAASVRTFMSDVREREGRLDVLVTAAGIALHGDSFELSDDQWQRVIDVNLTGTFVCAREGARQMVAAGNGGSIVAVGSISGEVANTPQSQAAYNASKGGVHVLVRCLAVEWAGREIRVNAVAPGYIDTPLTRAGVPETWREEWRRRTPLGRLAQPAEIASLVAFLASDAASYLTGSIVAADGGYLSL